jgi:quinol monooxygenase YgiN
LIADQREDLTMRYVRSTMASCFVVAGAFAVPPAFAQVPGDAVYAVTYIDISTDWVAQAVGLLKQYRDEARKEPGNLEFLVLEETDRPNRFAIIEGWKDNAAFNAHAKGANASKLDFILEAIRNAPTDRHMVHDFASAPSRPAANNALYMVEHVDFLGGDPSIAEAAQPLMKTLAAATQKEPGALRYDVLQQPPPRVNHYEVIGVWTDMKAFDAHEAAPHTRQFRAATTLPASPGRANLMDQRLYKVLD